MITIGIVPIDSRPCNTNWLSKLGHISDVNVMLLPIEYCGTLEKGAQPEAILNWLEQYISKFDYLILSTDALCFGGLVQARKGDKELEVINPFLNKIKDLLLRNKGVKVYLFDTLMRTSITAHNAKEAEYWKMINDYSYYMGHYHFYKDIDSLEQVNKLKEVIPSSILDSYLKARNVKHFLNLEFISWVIEGIADTMLLLQEDSMPYGIQQIEQESINQVILLNKIEDSVHFYNGTDEGALVLLGKIIYHCSPIETSVFIDYSCSEMMERVHLFEDHIFKDNFNKMWDTIGLKRASSANDCNTVFALFGGKANRDLDLSKPTMIPVIKDDSYKEFIKRINQYIKIGKNVILVDLYFPNGGTKELLDDIDYSKLSGYSGWNTSSNSLGSAICQLVGVLVHGNSLLNQDFTWERIADDCIYQTYVRRVVNERLIKDNINVYQLGDEYRYAEELIEAEFKKYDEFLHHHTFKTWLPWKRTFEIDIEKIK